MTPNVIFMARDAMLAQSFKLSVIGNNIANGNTTGYKSRRVGFVEHLGHMIGSSWATGQNVNVGRGVSLAPSGSDWSSGMSTATGVNTHIAISGDGLLPVELNGETHYTRAGDFQLVETAPGAGTFHLMRPDGSVLMGGTAGGNGAANVSGPVLITGAPTSIAININGEITVTDATVENGQLSLQRFANPDALLNAGYGLYKSTVPASILDSPAIPGSNGTGILMQGALEQSNVDIVNELTELIVTQRAYQANSRTITTANEMLQEALNIKR